MNLQSPLLPAGLPFARELPHDIKAEQLLLGALLVNNRLMERIGRIVEAHHFYDPLHAAIFESASRLINSGRLATPVTLKATFAEYDPIEGEAGEMSVPQYLGRLAAQGGLASYARDYAQLIRDHSTRRDMIGIAEDLARAAYNVGLEASPAELLDEAETHFDALRQRGPGERGLVRLYDAMQESIEQTNAAFMRGTGLAGLSTGLPSLDAALGGLAAPDLIVLGARPGMGKSALAGTIGLHVAKAGHPVGFWSLEMGNAQVGTRALAGETGISADAQRRGKINGDEDMRALRDCSEQFRDVDLYIDDSGGLTLARLANKIRAAHRQKKIAFAMVDYLQIMNGSPTSRQSNRVQEITEITRGLKALAMELHLPILLLSQLNRKLEDRDEKRPGLADLKESGSIEQDADVVIFVHREEYWLAKSRPAPDATDTEINNWLRDMKRWEGKAEVIIAKHRHAAPNVTVELDFHGGRTLFTDRT